MRDPKDYIIFPLDMPSAEEAEEYIRLLSGHVGMFKVGLELFIHAGPEIIHFIRASGETRVFLDLKLHDIPATVSRAMERVAELDVTYTTVHCGESRKMLEAAVRGGHGKVGVLGVTVLTSLSGDDIREAGFKPEYASDMSELVMKRANMAKTAGCSGIICSGHEVRHVKTELGNDFIAVTPGIRPSWECDKEDDQRRITTPAKAVKDGADYLVIGRPIRDAKSPRIAAIQIADEIRAAMR